MSPSKSNKWQELAKKMKDVRMRALLHKAKLLSISNRIGEKQFKEKFFIATTTSGTTNSPAVSMSLLSQISSYQALFSTYRIKGIKYTFLPYFKTAEYNQAVENTGNSLTYGGAARLHYCVDRNNPPTGFTEAQFITKDNVKTRYLDGLKKPFSVFVKNPNHIITVGNSLSEEGYGNRWLDINNSADVAHWGLTYLYQNPTGSGTTPLDVMVTIYFKAKNPR